MARRTNDARRLRFLAHYRRWGEVGRAAAYAGVSRSTGSRWLRAARQLVQDRADEVRERMDALLDEATDALLLGYRPGEGTGCDIPPQVSAAVIDRLTRNLGYAAPAKVDATVTHRRIEFVVRHEDDVVPDPPGREVAQRGETNGARLPREGDQPDR